MPAILPRASFTVVEAPVAHLLGKYELDIRDFFLGRQHLRAKMEAKFLPPGLADQFEKESERCARLLEGYKAPLEKLDPTLLGVVESAQEKMLYQFDKVEGQSLACGEHAHRRAGPARKEYCSIRFIRTADCRSAACARFLFLPNTAWSFSTNWRG